MQIGKDTKSDHLLDEIDRLQGEVKAAILPILRLAVQQGMVKPSVLQAAGDVQEYWAMKLDPSIAEKLGRIHDLNLRWHIDNGMY